MVKQSDDVPFPILSRNTKLHTSVESYTAVTRSFLRDVDSTDPEAPHKSSNRLLDIHAKPGERNAIKRNYHIRDV